MLYVKLDVASRTFVGTNPMLFTDGELSIVDAEISVRQIYSIRDEWTSSATVHDYFKIAILRRLVSGRFR